VLTHEARRRAATATATATTTHLLYIRSRFCARLQKNQAVVGGEGVSLVVRHLPPAPPHRAQQPSVAATAENAQRRSDAVTTTNLASKSALLPINMMTMSWLPF
jgi:predicted secreted protein